MDNQPSDEGFALELGITTDPEMLDPSTLEQAERDGDRHAAVHLACQRARALWLEATSDEAIQLWLYAVRLASDPACGDLVERPAHDLRQAVEGWKARPLPEIILEAWLIRASALLNEGDASAFIEAIEEATAHLLDRFGDAEPTAGVLLEQAARFAGKAGLFALMGELADRACVHRRLEVQLGRSSDEVDVDVALDRARLCWRGLMHAEQYERAKPHLESYCEICKRESRIRELALALEQLAEVHVQMGDLDAAWNAYAEAEAAHNAVHSGPQRLAQLVGLRAAIDHRRGRLEEARFGFMRALAGFDLAGERGMETVGVLRSYSTFLRAMGEVDEANALAALATSRTRAALTPPVGLKVTASLREARARARRLTQGDT